MKSMDIYFMSQAVDEAKQALVRGDVPVGAILTLNGEIIARGSNVKVTDPTAHAEMVVIRAGAELTGNWNLRGCDLYVTLEPCPMCAGAAVNARLRNIIFGAPDPRCGAAGTLYNIPRDARLNHRCGVRGGVLKDVCAALLMEYFKKKRSQGH